MRAATHGIMRGLLQTLCWMTPALAFAPLAAAQSPAALNDAFARMDQTARQFKSMSADVARDSHTAVINEDEKDSGTIKVKRDKNGGTRMLIDLTGSQPKTVAFDEKNVSVYYPKIKTVQIFSVGARRTLVDQLLLLGFGASSTALRSDYNVTLLGVEKIGSENTWHLQLIPKSPEALQRLKKAELWISQSNGLPLQQRFMTSSGGDFMLVTYSNMKLNPDIPDGALKLKYPKGVTEEHPQL